MENAFHFLHFRNAKWNFLVDALNVYRLCCQASSWFYPGLLILFKSYLTVAKSYLFHVFLPFLYSLLFPLVDMCSMSTSALCCHAHALILKHWSTPHLFLTSGIVFFCCVSVLELVCMCVGDQARWKESLVEIHQRFSSLYEGRWAESQRPVNGVCVCLWVCVCVQACGEQDFDWNVPSTLLSFTIIYTAWGQPFSNTQDTQESRSLRRTRLMQESREYEYMDDMKFPGWYN